MKKIALTIAFVFLLTPVAFAGQICLQADHGGVYKLGWNSVGSYIGIHGELVGYPHVVLVNGSARYDPPIATFGLDEEYRYSTGDYYSPLVETWIELDTSTSTGTYDSTRITDLANYQGTLTVVPCSSCAGEGDGSPAPNAK